MPIAYPLTPPNNSRFTKIVWQPKTVVSSTDSLFTGQSQVYAFTGQWWEVDITLTVQNRSQVEPWLAFLLALNGKFGTFSLGDSIGVAPQGTISGYPVVGSGAVANTTTLPITGGSGLFALGDWLQVGNNLHKVIQVNAGSVDVFPTLRSAYAAGTAITYNNAKGLFRLKAPIPWTAIESKLFDGLVISAKESVNGN